MGNRSGWLVLLIIATAIASSACSTPPSQARTEEAKQTPQQAAVVFQGSLVQVNTDTRRLTVKDAENKEMTFDYSEDTEIVGAGNSVQGLAGKSGERVKVTYTVQEGTNHSSRIEILPYY